MDSGLHTVAVIVAWLVVITLIIALLFARVSRLEEAEARRIIEKKAQEMRDEGLI